MLNTFEKDLRYEPKERMTTDAMSKIALGFINMNATSSMWRWGSRVRQCLEGSQFWVSKEVSDDLQASDIDAPDFATLEWPHDFLEIYFEDRTLPSFLFHRSRRDSLAEFISKQSEINISIEPALILGYSSETVLYDIYADTKDGGIVSVSLAASDMNAYAVSGLVNEHFDHHRAFNESDINEEENAGIMWMANMAFKALLFAASEGCAPRKTDDQPTKKQGGKPGFKSRPKRPRLIVEYLPRHRKERKEQSAAVTGKTHEFNGRRGHWRIYKSDRYVQMQGKRQFIYPVPDKNGNYPKRQLRLVK